MAYSENSIPGLDHFLLQNNLDSKMSEETDSQISPKGKEKNGIKPVKNTIVASKISPIKGAKRLRAAIVTDEIEVEVPEGWNRQVVQRQGGSSAGKYDVYYFSPLGKKLRSRKEVQTHCEMNNLPFNLEMFKFARASLGGAQKVKKMPKTPATIPATMKSPKAPKTPKVINPKPPKISPTKLFNKEPNKKKAKLKPEKRNNPIKLSTEAFTKKKKRPVWVPPKSPFNLFQESLFQNPWKLLTGTIILNRAAGEENVGNNLVWEFFKRWPSPEVLLKSNWKEIDNFISSVPNHERVAKIILKFSEEYLGKKWMYPKELHGIGKYGNDSYRIFCINEWRKVKPTDYLLTFYVDWLWDNHAVLGLD